MSFVRIAELEIDPAQLDGYHAAVKEEMETSVRIEPGVLAIYAVAEKDAPTRLRFFEIYADEAAYRAHIGSPHFRKYFETTKDMITSRRLIDTVPLQLSAKPRAGAAPAPPLIGATLPLKGSRQAHPMDQRTDTRDVDGRGIPVLGLLACAFALIPMFAVLAAKMLYTIGGRYRDLGKSVGALALGYGLALEVLAVLAAVWAIVSAGPNRRIGFVALALVALSIALLYL